MVVFISDRQISSNLKKVGFIKVDPKVNELINEASFRLVRRTLEKAMKKAILKGGRVTMPLEYYGIRTDNFVADAKGTDMTATESRIRPHFDAIMSGGAGDKPLFVLSFATTQNMCKEVMTTSNVEVIVRQTAMKKIHIKLVALLSEFMATLKRRVKGDVLKPEDVKGLLVMKKFVDFA